MQSYNCGSTIIRYKTASDGEFELHESYEDGESYQ